MAPAFINAPLPRALQCRRRSPGIAMCTALPRKPAPSAAAPLRTPVHRRIPVLGFLLDVFVFNVNNVMLARRYGPVYKTDILGVPMTFVTDLEAIKTCYKDADTFRSGGAYPPTFAAFFGESALFIQDGAAHAEKRSSVLPGFSPQLFPLYFDGICEAALASWERVAEQVRENGPTELKTFIKDHYLRIILRITAGDEFTTKSDSTAEEQYLTLRDEFLKVTAGIFSLPITRSWREGIKSRDSLISKLSLLICDRLAGRADTIDALRANGADHVIATAKTGLRTGALDLLTVLCASSPLKTGPGVTHNAVALRDLAELVLLLWYAGFATQATTTLCCVLEALKDRKIWMQLQEEQDGIVKASGTRQMTFEQVSKEMPLLDSFVTEVLRIYPPALLFRKTSKPVIVCGHSIEADTVVALDPWGAQRDAKYYPNPDELQVDRFVTKEGKAAAPVPPATASFGVVGGAHYCLGRALANVNMKATLGTMLREFNLELEPGQDMTYRQIPEMVPASGVVVNACERRKVAVEPVVRVQ